MTPDALDARLNAFRPDLADVALQGRVAAKRFVAGRSFRVKAACAPVRESPAPNAMMTTEALFGEPLKVFDTDPAGWAWVQLETDGYVGWMRLDDVAEGGEEPTHRVAAIRTFAFAAADIKSIPLLALPMGAAVRVVGEAEDRNARYGLIEPAGAIVMQHLEPAGQFAADWTAVAARFAGSPYLWGGKTALGLDCSGLVQVALAACGRKAPRDTDMQEAALGQPVWEGDAMPALRRGDLVFWRGHVGIMADGETLLHANAHHMAVVAEPLEAVVTRAEARGSRVSSVKRMP